MMLARNSFLRRGGYASQDAIGAPMRLQFTPAQYQAALAGHAQAAVAAHPMMRFPQGIHVPAANNPMAGFRFNPPPFSPAVAAAAAGSGEPEAAYWGVDSGSTLIAAGNAATITVQPQEACWPAGLNLTSTIADQFLISGIFVGVQPLLTTTGALSAAIFVQNTTAPRFRRIFLQVGKNFTIGVVNFDAVPRRFACTAFGPSAEPRGAQC
jgi:hypothetical protein